MRVKPIVLAILVGCSPPSLADELDDLLAHHDVDCGYTSYEEGNPNVTKCENTVATCLPDALAQHRVAIFMVDKLQPATDVPTFVITRDSQVLEFVDARSDEFVHDVTRRYCVGLALGMQGSCQIASGTDCSAWETEDFVHGQPL